MLATMSDHHRLVIKELQRLYKSIHGIRTFEASEGVYGFGFLEKRMISRLYWEKETG